jgi:Ankyrin repeats (many copies)
MFQPPTERALLAAAERGDIGEVKKLAQEGWNPNCKDECAFTPLHRALLGRVIWKCADI